MTREYKVEDGLGQLWDKENIVMVFNYHNANVIQMVAGFDINAGYNKKDLVGVWKIKKLKV